jgi:hypothetical protein
MESKPCNIVLLPNSELTAKIISISETLRLHGTLFTLKNGSFYPHMSLYMFELKNNDYQSVQDVLQEISTTQSEYNLAAVKYDQKMSFIDAEYEVTSELLSLQDLIISKINPIRNGMREKDKQRMEQADGLKRDYFKKYGYPNVKELFRPHVTFTRFSQERLFDVDQLPKISTFNGAFNKLGFFESGDNGTCIRLISSYDLK